MRVTYKKTEPAVRMIYKKAEPTVRVTSKKTKPTVSAFFKKATPAVCSTSKAMLMLVTPMWRLLWRAQSPGHHVLVRTMWIVDPPSINRRRGKKCTYHAQPANIRAAAAVQD